MPARQCGSCAMYGREKCSDHGKNSTIRTRSGRARSDNTLVTFLYVLMRDKMPTGEVEEMVLRLTETPVSEWQFTNGWLAEYAQDLAERLSGERVYDVPQNPGETLPKKEPFPQPERIPESGF